jgi:uncharacterized protein (TIGR00369 family)
MTINDESSMQQTGQNDALIKLAAQAQDTFWGRLGCEVVKANREQTTISLIAGDGHMNLFGIVHGGVLMSLLDNAMGLVAIMAAPDCKIVTANMNTQFLASAGRGILYCEAELVHATERTMTMQAAVKDEHGKLLAWGGGAYRLLKRKG